MVVLAERFWSKHVTRGEARPRDANAEAFARTLPRSFHSFLSMGPVAGVEAPGFHVADVGDWLVHAWERHLVMRGLADGLDNPRLAEMVPFGDSDDGFELAFDRVTGRVVWLDPERFDCGDEAVAGVAAETFDAWIASFDLADLGGKSDR